MRAMHTYLPGACDRLSEDDASAGHRPSETFHHHMGVDGSRGSPGNEGPQRPSALGGVPQVAGFDLRGDCVKIRPTQSVTPSEGYISRHAELLGSRASALSMPPDDYFDDALATAFARMAAPLQVQQQRARMLDANMSSEALGCSSKPVIVCAPAADRPAPMRNGQSCGCGDG